jgi:Type III restriction enzyme, res subunit
LAAAGRISTPNLFERLGLPSSANAPSSSSIHSTPSVTKCSPRSDSSQKSPPARCGPRPRGGADRLSEDYAPITFALAKRKRLRCDACHQLKIEQTADPRVSSSRSWRGDDSKNTPAARLSGEVISRICDAIASGIRRILLRAPTGSGKTVVAAEIMRKAASQGRRVLFLDHRRELTKQASRKLYEFGVDHGIVQAGFPG